MNKRNVNMQALELPQTIMIGLTRYAVNPEGRRPPSDCWGEHHFGRAEILIDMDQRPMMVARTYLHEIFHALYDAADLEGRQDEETVVRGLTTAFVAMMRDNPNVLDPIHEAIGIGRREQLIERSMGRGTF
jgi:hypothetical protein